MLFIPLEQERNPSFEDVFGASLYSSIIFFIVSNFIVWIMPGGYPPTFAGFIQCYVMAIPFFGSTLVSTTLYSAILFFPILYPSTKTVNILSNN